MRETSKSGRHEARAVDPAALAALSGRITALQPQKRNASRLSLYVDGQFVLGLDQEVALALRLRVGDAVDGHALAAALSGDEQKRAKDDALRFLATRPRTAAEVRRKLTRRYQPEVIEETLSFLERNRLLDDAAFARAWAEAHPGWGAHRLRADLIRRGVARAVVDQVLADEPDRSGEAVRAVEARYRRMSGVDAQTARRRLYGFLIRRGFDYAAAEQAVRQVMAASGED